MTPEQISELQAFNEIMCNVGLDLIDEKLMLRTFKLMDRFRLDKSYERL